MASFAHASPASEAAKGVLFREPLKPTRPALDQATTPPVLSVMVTIVLLKVACMWATPLSPTFRSRRLGLLPFGFANSYTSV
jgi:hypothetical protein